MSAGVQRFAMIPLSAAKDARLSKNDYRVLIALYCSAGKNGKCHPKRQTLSDLTGLAITKISTITSRLVALGWIEKKGNGGHSCPVFYQLKTPETVTKTGTVTKTETVTETVTKTVTETGTGKEKTYEKTVNKRESWKEKITERDMAGAEWMYKKILDVYSGQPKPDFFTWANTIRLMREKDKHSHEDIAKVFTWANSDRFWKSNIRSPEKLRDKWHDLAAQMGNENENSKRTGNRSGGKTAAERNQQVSDYLRLVATGSTA